MNNLTKNNNRKEEILEKNRQSKKDEGLEYAQSKGNTLGEKILSVVSLPLAFYSIFIGEFAIAWAIGAMAFAYVLGQSISVYRFTNRKYHLTWIILSIVMIIFFIVSVLAETQGWWVTWGWGFELLARWR